MSRRGPGGGEDRPDVDRGERLSPSAGDVPAERAAALLQRLITDPDYRAAFRRRPAEEARAFGLEELASGLDGSSKALQTLEIRESKSSLAGLMMAAAAEGFAAVELLRHAEDHLGGEAASAASRTLTRTGLRAADRDAGGPPAPPAASQPTPARLPAAGRPPDADGGSGSRAANDGVEGPGAATRRSSVPAPPATDPAPQASDPPPPLSSDRASRSGAGGSQTASRGAEPAPGSGMRNTARELPAARRRDENDAAPPLDGDGAAADAAASGYPGDGASQAEIAAWMADAARRAGVPPEVVLIAALQESGLRNLRHGDRDSVGFFQMRASIWDRGEYRGYLDRPELQLRWFIKQALEARRTHPGRYGGPGDYGEWAADIERCAEQYRGRYQGHLEHARQLLRASGAAEGHGSASAADAATGASADGGERDETPVGEADGDAPVAAAEQPGMMRNTAQAMPAARGAAEAADGLDAAAGGSVGEKMVRIAEREVGQAESPPGSNESSRIAHYREATRGAPGPGPWCAYFVSWVASKAGSPLGDQGQGFGLVDAVWGWAESANRTIPAHGGESPRPGDLMVLDEHIGLVEKVLPGGRIQTIEGNSGDHVARRIHSMSEPIVGYVRMR